MKTRRGFILFSLVLLGWGLVGHLMVGAPPAQPSGQLFAFVDYDFIFTLELVRPGVPILNFVHAGKGNYFLKADEIRIIAGIKLYRPRLFEVDTSVAKDPMRISGLRVHPHSSFGLTLVGDLAGLEAIDKVTVKLGADLFQLQPMDKTAFEVLAKQVNQLNLLSPDIREDFRVLEIRPCGSRKAGELR